MVVTYAYRVVEGCTIKYDFYPTKSAGLVPVIVWIHGGALIGGGRSSMQPVVRDMLTEKGFAQVSIDYRLAPETKLPAIIDDVREAFRSIREALTKERSIDPARVGVIGGSAGGYLTLMTGFAVTPRPKALVSLYGYGDLVGPWYSEPDPFYCTMPRVSEEEARSVTGGAAIAETPRGGPDRFRFYLWCRQNGFWPKEIMGVDPKVDDAAFTPYCPERNVTREYPPTLLLHGNADTDVPYERSVDMAKKLKDANVEHELITIEGGPHGFDGRIKRKDWPAQRDTPTGQSLLRIVDWFVQRV
jgi:acetyl esterase/lipase